MKNNRLLLTIIIFFLLVNTSYYWEGYLELYALPVFSLLVILFPALFILLIKQISRLIKDRITHKSRIYQIVAMTILLVLVAYKPRGIIDFEKLGGKDLLLADREGGGNCVTTLKLKDDGTFREKITCFGITEIIGRYELRADTIFFKDVNKGRENDYFSYALVRPSHYQNKAIIGILVRFNSKANTDSSELSVTKNELKYFTEGN